MRKIPVIFILSALLLTSCTETPPDNPQTLPSTDTSQGEVFTGSDVETTLPPDVREGTFYIDRRAGKLDDTLLTEQTFTYIGSLSPKAVVAATAAELKETFVINSIEERDGGVYVDWSADSVSDAFCSEKISEDEVLTDKLWTVLDSVYLTLKKNFGCDIFFSFDGKSLENMSDTLVLIDKIDCTIPFGGSQTYASMYDKAPLYDMLEVIAEAIPTIIKNDFGDSEITDVSFIDLNFDGTAEMLLYSPPAANGVSIANVYSLVSGKPKRIGDFSCINDDTYPIRLVYSPEDEEYFYYSNYDARTTAYSNILVLQKLSITSNRLYKKELFSREGMFPIELDSPKPEDMEYLYYVDGRSKTEEEYTTAAAKFTRIHEEIEFSDGKTKYNINNPKKSITEAAESCTLMTAREHIVHDEDEDTETSVTAVQTAALPTETAQTTVSETTASATETAAPSETTTEPTTTAETTTEETTSTEPLTDENGSIITTEATTTTTKLVAIKRDKNNNPYIEE